MANTKIPVELSSTPSIVDNGDATAITIDSSELVGIGTTSPVTHLHLESSAATQFRIRTTSSSSEPQMIMIDGAGDYFAMQKVDKGMTFKPQGTVAMKIDDAGHVTKPLQSAFNVFSNSTQSSISTGYTTVQMDAEVFDVNADFDVSTYTFTAPVTGKYLLQAHVSIRELPLNAGWFLVGILTSNGAYNFSRTTTPYDADFGGTLFTLPVTVVADMDANDTAYVRAYQYSGTAQTDIYGHSSNPYTYFSGYLLG